MSSLIISRFRIARSRDRLSMKFAATATAVMLFAGSAATAEAHGGRHGSPQVETEAGVHLAAGRRHGNDAYIKAASENREKLLNSKLKDICRGC
jgi:hypothetical protein